MGLFGVSAPEIRHADLVNHLVADESRRKLALKRYAKCEEALAAELMRSGENPVLLTIDAFNVLAVTAKRSLAVDKKGIAWQMSHSDAAETKINAMRQGPQQVQYSVLLISRNGLVMHPNDPKYDQHVRRIYVDSAETAQQVCSAIDQYIA